MITISWKDSNGIETSFSADVARSVTDAAESEVTEHPIERGSFAVDHTIRKPRHVTLELVHSNEPIDEIDGWRKRRTDLDVVASRFKPRGLLLLHSAVSGAVGGLLGRGKEQGAKAFVLTSTTAPDRILALHDSLLTAWQNSARCEFAFKGRQYRDMQITRVGRADVGTSAPKFTLEFREIRTVTTATADLPEPESFHAKKTATKGKQAPKNPSEAEKDAVSASILSQLTGSAADMISAGIR